MKGNEIRVRDLGSTNGTYIDDERIMEGVLTPERVLRLGNVRFRLEEVLVTPANPTAAAPAPELVELAKLCVYHPEIRAAFKCENCGAGVCHACVTVVGQGKFEATTICPVCKGQCYPLPQPEQPTASPSLFRRLTQTLKIPFSR